MKIYFEVEEIRGYLKEKKSQQKSIGFVPTMGALHNGHLELLKRSIEQNDLSVCSIFVNPTQFNNPADLKNYPIETDSDLVKLEEHGCDIVFMPQANDMYKGETVMNFDFGYLEQIMEGRFRPGHFKGVGLIVSKLFNIVLPNRAYFGKKDLQQLTLIKTLTKELFFDIDIISVDTVREQDGLAMSSRNKLLTIAERSHATDLHKALLEAKGKLNAGESVVSVKESTEKFFQNSSQIKLEYFEIVNSHDLRNIEYVENIQEVSLCIAGYLGKVRLIDNMSLN